MRKLVLHFLRAILAHIKTRQEVPNLPHCYLVSVDVPKDELRERAVICFAEYWSRVLLVSAEAWHRRV